MRNAADGVGPDGIPWAPLSEAYAERKAKDFPGAPIGVRSGLMLDRDNVVGLRRVTPAEAISEYGTSEEAQQEIAYFSEGDHSRNRPARPVVGLTDEAIQLIDILLEAEFRRAVEG